MKPTLQEARRIAREEGKTVFLDFRTDPTENVFPMVQAGKGITEMLLGTDELVSLKRSFQRFYLLVFRYNTLKIND